MGVGSGKKGYLVHHDSWIHTLCAKGIVTYKKTKSGGYVRIGTNKDGTKNYLFFPTGAIKYVPVEMRTEKYKKLDAKNMDMDYSLKDEFRGLREEAKELTTSDLQGRAGSIAQNIAKKLHIKPTKVIDGTNFYWELEDILLNYANGNLDINTAKRYILDLPKKEKSMSAKGTKTRLDLVVQGNYGQGWEDLTSEDKYSEARQRLREYNENENYPHRLIRRRVKLDAKHSFDDEEGNQKYMVWLTGKIADSFVDVRADNEKEAEAKARLMLNRGKRDAELRRIKKLNAKTTLLSAREFDNKFAKDYEPNEQAYATTRISPGGKVNIYVRDSGNKVRNRRLLQHEKQEYKLFKNLVKQGTNPDIADEMAHNINPVKLEGVDAYYQLNPNN